MLLDCITIPTFILCPDLRSLPHCFSLPLLSLVLHSLDTLCQASGQMSVMKDKEGQVESYPGARKLSKHLFSVHVVLVDSRRGVLEIQERRDLWGTGMRTGKTLEGRLGNRRTGKTHEREEVPWEQAGGQGRLFDLRISPRASFWIVATSLSCKAGLFGHRRGFCILPWKIYGLCIKFWKHLPLTWQHCYLKKKIHWYRP